MIYKLDMQISLRAGEHGWSDFDLWLGDTHKEFCLTHIFSSPFVEIANALFGLLNEEDKASFDLHEDPGHYLWRVSMIPSSRHLVEVEIRSYGENFKVAGAPEETTTFIVQRDFFVTVFVSELSKIETQLSYPGFSKNRNFFDFPYNTLKELRRKKSNQG